MKKRLTESEFQAAIEGLDIGDQTREIAHGVLVKGKPQADYVAMFGVTKGAIWQAVKRVWEAHEACLPHGYEKVTAVLPEHQAFIVRKWSADAQKRLETKT